MKFILVALTTRLFLSVVTAHTAVYAAVRLFEHLDHGAPLWRAVFHAAMCVFNMASLAQAESYFREIERSEK